jgi:hypothetical protein
VENILVKIRDSFMPVDFVVLEMDAGHQTPLILGRPFLTTTAATIYVAAWIIKLNINGKEETFAFKTKRIQYCNQLKVSTGSTENNAKTPRKKPNAAKYSKPKSTWRMKNVTSIVPPSPVTLAD